MRRSGLVLLVTVVALPLSWVVGDVAGAATIETAYGVECSVPPNTQPWARFNDSVCAGPTPGEAPGPTSELWTFDGADGSAYAPQIAVSKMTAGAGALTLPPGGTVVCMAWRSADGSRRVGQVDMGNGGSYVSGTYTYHVYASALDGTGGGTATFHPVDASGTGDEWWWYSGAPATTGNNGACRGANYREVAATVADMPAPEYACGRTLRDVGEGQWFADLEAVGPLNPISSSIGTDSPGNRGWVFNGQMPNREMKRTVALPPLASMPAGGWRATFHAYRGAAAGHMGQAPDTSKYDRVEWDEDGAGPEAPWWWYAPNPVTWPGWLVTLHRQTAVDLSPEAQRRWALENYGGFRLEKADGGDPAVGGGDWVEIKTTCTVVLDPTVQDQAEGGTVQLPPATGGPATPRTKTPGPGGGGCDAGRLGSLPLLGGIFDRTAALACSIGDIIGRLWDLLYGLFGPPEVTFSDLWAGYDGVFPFTVTNEAGALVDGFGDRFTTAAEGSVCGRFDFSGILGGDDQALNVKLPTPSDSGCARNAAGTGEEAAGDVFGWRAELRMALLLMLSIGFMYRVVAAFSPKPTGLEPVP